MVKPGDVLATLDASTYEEMLRQQEITVEQAKASHLQASSTTRSLYWPFANTATALSKRRLKGMEGSIALARSDLSRAKDHLTWTERMKEKGYASPAQIVSEKHTVSQLELALTKQLTSLELFQRFTLPMTEKSLQGQVTSAETASPTKVSGCSASSIGLQLLKKQVTRCTIRAPHDGVLFYFKGGNPRGQSVRRGRGHGSAAEAASLLLT